MIKIDECLIEKEQCEDSCRNVLIKNNVPLSVYTNTSSFVGVSARVESECTCEVTEPLDCLNGGEFMVQFNYEYLLKTLALMVCIFHDSAGLLSKIAIARAFDVSSDLLQT